MTEALSKELKTYEANLEVLLGSHEGKFVLIHGEKVLGTFDSQMDAITWGYRELGNVPFLVKQVLRVDVPLSFVSNLLGVSNAVIYGTATQPAGYGPFSGHASVDRRSCGGGSQESRR